MNGLDLRHFTAQVTRARARARREIIVEGQAM